MNNLLVVPNHGTSLPKLHSPWMIAVWPGMGNIAVNAGFYLAAKLQMAAFAEFSPSELFDVEQVEVVDGVIRPARLPRSRLFLWRDPAQKRDLILFVGEAQPSVGKRAFCRNLIDFAKAAGVERIYTFAAMATEMHPEQISRVFVAGTNQPTLDEVALLDVQILREGTIGGLNGVLLGEAAAAELHGACLLGEMPQIFSQLPYPGASLAVLKVFREFSGIPFDTDELEQDAQDLSEKLGKLLSQIEGRIQEVEGSPNGETEELETPAIEPTPAAPLEPKLSAAAERRIEDLFQQAKADRSKAYELKQTLDRAGVFADYEDRFLDLFRPT